MLGKNKFIFVFSKDMFNLSKVIKTFTGLQRIFRLRFTLGFHLLALIVHDN